jgi:hypothetical protein
VARRLHSKAITGTRSDQERTRRHQSSDEQVLTGSREERKRGGEEREEGEGLLVLVATLGGAGEVDAVPYGQRRDGGGEIREGGGKRGGGGEAGWVE